MPTPVEATGILVGPMQLCRELVASSATFRATCGVQPYELCMTQRVHIQHKASPIVRPFCLITDEDREIRRGGFGSATFLLAFEREVPSDFDGFDEFASNWFLEWLGQVLQEMRDNVDDLTYFSRLFLPDRGGMSKTGRIMRSDPDIEPVDFIRAMVTIRAGF